MMWIMGFVIFLLVVIMLGMSSDEKKEGNKDGVEVKIEKEVEIPAEKEKEIETKVKIEKEVETPVAISKPKKVSDVVETDSFRDNFLVGCYDGYNMEYCECTYDFIEDSIGKKEFLKQAVEYEETGTMPDILMDAILGCYETI